ncbi:hypothetical protein DV735_g702, partial [Chaetothyriales sp. CBS 134920]
MFGASDIRLVFSNDPSRLVPIRDIGLSLLPTLCAAIIALPDSSLDDGSPWTGGSPESQVVLLAFEAIEKVCSNFPDEYWQQHDQSESDPKDFHAALAADGWLGIALPEAFGGAGLGISEATMMLQTITQSGAGMAGAQSIHANVYATQPLAKFGNKEQLQSTIPNIISGKWRVCFGVTEPNTGLDTLRLKTFARKSSDGTKYVVSGQKIWITCAQVASKMMLLARTTPVEETKKPSEGLSLFCIDLDKSAPGLELKKIKKMGGRAVDANEVFFDNYEIPADTLIGEENKGFKIIMHGMNAERCLLAGEALGIGYAALEKARKYAKERNVFGRPIGKNQAVAHPLADSFMSLEAAKLATYHAAGMYDRSGKDSSVTQHEVGIAANSAKYLAAEAAFKACERAILVHGGMGYAVEYNVERYMREIFVPRIAPVSREMILNFVFSNPTLYLKVPSNRHSTLYLKVPSNRHSTLYLKVMSQVKEVPDQVDESAKTNEALATQGPKSLKDLYEARLDAPNALSDKSFEELMFDMSKMPLFMDNKDVMAAAGEDDNLVEAFRALQYEGTKSEVVQGFKDQGNEAVKEKRWKDAKEFYTKGIAVLTSKEGKWDRPEDEAAEAQQLKVLEEQVYANRALCNLELTENYRSTTLDCAAALRINPRNIKAHYRSASALLALNKVHEALDVCYRGLKIDEDNVALKKLLPSIRTRAAEIEKQDRRRRAELKRKHDEQEMLRKVLAERGVRTRGVMRQSSLDDAVVRLSPDPLSPTSLLEFPVMLLYPMHMQSDLIKAWAEKDDLSQHLSYILPTPWDDKQLYTVSSVECYMDTITGGMMKVGKKLKLLEVLSNGKTEVVDGLVRIYVVPASLAGQWIDEVKKATR